MNITVLNRDEVKRLLSFLDGPYLLMIRSGKGEKDRALMIPGKIKEELAKHLVSVDVKSPLDGL